MRRVCFWVSVTAAIAGCSGGHWVDTGVGFNELLCASPAQLEQEAKRVHQSTEQFKDSLKTIGQRVCGKAGGAFTGDMRCENGVGQVKCK